MAKTAVVTGGTLGIGLATVEHLARDGWNVAVIARDEARLAQVAARLDALGVRALTISADVADAAAVDAAAARVERELGPIDAWVNNAMSSVIAKADEITPEEYARVTATTYLSQVHGTLAALRYMKPRRRGAIVQVSSGLGIRGAPLQAAYCAAKFAVSGFTDSLRAELIADDVPVTLTVVYLPAVNTPQTEVSRVKTGRAQILPDPLFDPRLAAKAIVSAIRKPCRELWVGRTTVQMAVLQSLAPALADRQASLLLEPQQGGPLGFREGNLFEAVPGPARIDGTSLDRMHRTRSEFFTSRQRDLLKVVTTVGLVALGGVLGGAYRQRRH
jgi:NAD(P)-dependent dehydrogenase (short-subunit alcohol dehydrogenase family)